MLAKLEEIAEHSGCKYEKDVFLAPYTTWRVGGPADVLFTPSNIDQCVNLLNLLYRSAIPYFILGKGSNLLVGDRGFRGAVIKLNGLKSYEFNSREVIAESGCSLPLLAREAAGRGLAGMEFAAGIPGTIGGAVRMNAGAEGSAIQDIFKAALVWQNGELKEFTLEQMEFSYRHSVIKNIKAIVLQSTFQLHKGDQAKIKERTQQYLSNRKTKQPLDYPNAGSVFKNPSGTYAGKLIADAGLKGKSIGGAKVSQKHANFIINTGEATANDIKALMDAVQQEVAKFSNIWLEPEVEFVGEF